ncbi:MAG: hypothetical protein V7640_3289 [Betaproteobacteria bacterium]|jgi:hypothetical protein
MNLDGRGIPGVSIVTTEFADAVEVQSTALGFDPAIVFVPHPIQNRTPEELARIADDAIEPALKFLQGQS